MKSVLRKLLEREFGRDRYHIYTEKLNRKESMDIFCDIYGNLMGRSEEKLNLSLYNLLVCIQDSIVISKNFSYISIAYFAAMLFFFIIQPVWYLLYPAMLALTCCYMYKFLEFLWNRYCDRDVRIVLLYKIALFHLLERTGAGEEA